MKKTLLNLILMLLCTISPSFADDITINLSQKSVSITESFSLIFSTHQSIQEQPDFSPLQADFDVISNSQEHSTSFINGIVTQQIRWKLVLIAKHEGALTIPAIQFGQYKSMPQTIEVTQSSAAKKDDLLYLKTEIYPVESAYEQAMLIYTIKLYSSVNIAQASLSEPKTNDPDTLIEQLGNEREYEYYNKSGKRYMVIERKYAVYPQHAGELIFSPVAFEGKVITGKNSFFDVQTQFKRVLSEQHKIEIKPIPAPFQRNNWIAAKDLKLTEEWSADTKQMLLGEPITWTLKITADGCLGNQIPDIALNFPADMKHYLDKPVVSSQYTSDSVLGTKQIKIALIATKAGAITLPEIAIKWWDVEADQMRQTQLPARTIQVQPETVAMNTKSSEQPHYDVSSAHIEQKNPESQSLPVWVWCLIGVNGILLIGFIRFLYNKISFKFAKPNSTKQIKYHLKIACKANNAKKAEECIRAWAGIILPQVKPLNIMTLKKHLSIKLQEALDELYQALYSNNCEWNGSGLWKAFKAFKPAKIAKAHDKARVEVLQELYPRD